METIIRIKKNKPAFKALILLAKELEKSDHTSISISEVTLRKKKMFDLIEPQNPNDNVLDLLNQFEDFPTLDELRKQAWPKA